MNNFSTSLNIQSLFEVKIDNVQGELDINNLFGNQKDEYEFDSSILLKIINKEQDKVIKYINIEFKKCCEEIINASKNSLTSVICKVQDKIIDCELYNSSICLEFIKNKINKENIKCHIIGKRKILFDWTHFITGLKVN